VLAAVGGGWGKSAMAQGYVARGWGLGWRSCVVQFVKGPDWHPRVAEFAHQLGIEWHVFGAGMTWASSARRDPTDRAAAAWSVAAERLVDGSCDLVVLDEVGLALAYGWLELDEVVARIGARARHTNVILTAPELPAPLLELADTITTFERTRDGLGRPLS
jgi:cob(I)alamin adenosyltransferase